MRRQSPTSNPLLTIGSSAGKRRRSDWGDKSLPPKGGCPCALLLLPVTWELPPAGGRAGGLLAVEEAQCLQVVTPVVFQVVVAELPCRTKPHTSIVHGPAKVGRGMQLLQEVVGLGERTAQRYPQRTGTEVETAHEDAAHHMVDAAVVGLQLRTRYKFLKKDFHFFHACKSTKIRSSLKEKLTEFPFTYKNKSFAEDLFESFQCPYLTIAEHFALDEQAVAVGRRCRNASAHQVVEGSHGR